MVATVAWQVPVEVLCAERDGVGERRLCRALRDHVTVDVVEVQPPHAVALSEPEPGVAPRHAPPWWYSTRTGNAAPGRFDLELPRGTVYWGPVALGGDHRGDDGEVMTGQEEPPVLSIDALQRLAVCGPMTLLQPDRAWPTRRGRRSRR